MTVSCIYPQTYKQTLSKQTTCLSEEGNCYQHKLHVYRLSQVMQTQMYTHTNTVQRSVLISHQCEKQHTDPLFSPKGKKGTERPFFLIRLHLQVTSGRWIDRAVERCRERESYLRCRGGLVATFSFSCANILSL